ncbi:MULTISPECIES: hypothetical protein [unclassified Fusibacter]|uniref:hypothetical protein n=1 Tax=unclassified Fusibacter TaxID=2624464 RepID=UPI0010135200|nr:MULTISPECIES: hypothetical protein [unclassified Fusibacter]MCK8061424.1 hypothetical protein [Fusibacter sp. A2]NPE23533.1 hypothetical protein [Fusibacter sp. A1]RXV58944.1 hypothetical protein DWB64_17210 [Fusibacter sp. A1]
MEFLQNEFGIFLISYILTIAITTVGIVKKQQKELKIYLVRNFGAKYRMITFLGMMSLVVSLPMILSYLSFSNMASAMPMGFALAIYVTLNRVRITEEDLSEE